MANIETLEEKVDRFKEYYLGLIKTAECEQNITNQKVHSKILSCSIFDAISKSIFPEISSNCQRFTALVRLCENWPESQKVSLLHLVRLLEITPNLPSSTNELKIYATQQFESKFPNSNSIMSNNKAISSDVEIEAILELWPTQNGKPIKIGKVLPHQLKHEYLLWLYRNSVVHEYRNPGRGVELGLYVPEYAFYQEMATVSKIDEKEFKFTSLWELVYPYRFFINLCKEALDVVSLLHNKNKTSPFQAYSEGTFWLPNFNE
ncbi:MAG: hypothetical protein ACTIMZ_12760 [Pseudoalteromonas distincta]|uniref:hypothetical protein n=1 Tax=Pseudoalteromonas distincta TaxID=77608 RepID=UPI003F9EB3B2